MSLILDTWIGRLIAGLVVGVVSLKGWLLFHHDPKVRREVTTSIAKQSEKISEKANAARAAARKPGSVDRVREWCRDCDG